jgi:Bacteriocin-protection, YdeI or OmpD-Associated/Domain of unknown function (DUF1905)
MRYRTTILQTGKAPPASRSPTKVVEALGSGRRPAVKVTVNGYTYRSAVATMGGTPMISLSAEHRLRPRRRRRGRGRPGARRRPGEVEIPPDLAAALDAEPAARRTFDALSYSNRSWHVLQVTGAKTDETRQRRIAKSVEAPKEGRLR